MMIGIVGLLTQVALIVVVVLFLRRFFGKKTTGAVPAHSLRRFFQYFLLYGLLVIAAVGTSGLIGRLFARDTMIVASNSELARNLSFAIVGIPLFCLVALWSRRRFSEDPDEVHSYGFRFYLTVAPLTALVVSMFALNDILHWAFRLDDFSGSALARFIIWAPIWYIHWRIYGHSASTHRSEPHDILGTLIGLGTSVAGLSGVAVGTISALTGFNRADVFAPANPILQSMATLIVGTAVWAIYWIRNTAESERNSLWLSLVLLVGVGGGLLMAVISASTVLYSFLVWVFGNPASTDAHTYFHNLPSGISFTAVGILAWWYHREVLADITSPRRSEVQRLYEYLIAGIGLLAAAGGLAMVIISLIEAMSNAKVITAQSQTNTLLAALTLLIVGVPIWWIFWHRLQHAMTTGSKEEHASPTRRVYLFLLFGVGGIAAVIALLVGVYLIFNDIFSNAFGLSTLNRMRFAVGILLTTAAIAGYHWTVYRAERMFIKVPGLTAKYVLLIGPKDPELSHAISSKTGGHVETWIRTDDVESAWPHEKVLEVIGSTTAKELILLVDKNEIQAIPIERSRPST
ncbi:hypothetical protein GALL_375110 [mine drainage metagenome]|uniref:DUF5671 domain-containing protein n=1 Tax=mine drainage metagenome TaxID=410659 RepID=A0A1J5QC06_9ZZZZ